MKRLLLGVVAGAAMMYYRVFGGPMEGTAWDVKLKADSFFAFSRRDRLVFEKGKLTIEGYHETLAPSPYDARRVGGDIDAMWSAALTDDERGTMTWHGLVRGDTIEGVAILHTPDGKRKRFTFTGRRA